MTFGPQSKEEAEVFALEELRADIQYDILKAMKRQNMTQAALAKKLGRSAAWVSQILGDDANLTLETISKVYLALGMRCHVAALPAETDYRSALWETSVAGWALPDFEFGRIVAADFTSEIYPALAVRSEKTTNRTWSQRPFQTKHELAA